MPSCTTSAMIAGVYASCACLLASSQQSPSQPGSIPTFGTTVVVSSGLRGQIYFIPPDTEWLPRFERLKPVGTIYTSSLNVPPSDFRNGFPGITTRYEWFAIDYTGRFWIEEAGRYRFGITSDDGSKLYLDSHVIIDNDGLHPPSGCAGAVELARGIHSIRLSYFQGPRFEVALILVIARPGRSWQLFNTSDFTPPADSSVWNRNEGKQPRQQLRNLKRGNCWAP